MKWFSRKIAVVNLPPDGAEPRGFRGKNAFADQLNLLGERIRTIFDVGANTGQTVDHYLELFPDATIYSFEPFPPCHEELLQRFAHNQHVKPYRLAVSDMLGKCMFHTYTNNVTNSLLPRHGDAYQFVAAGQMDDTGIIEVDSSTVDEICQREGIKHIDVLKLDIQGGELKALRGADRMLKRQAISLIFSEVSFVPVYKEQAQWFDVARFLYGYGYQLFDFYNFAYSDTSQLKWGDAIFLPHRRL